MTAVMMLGLVAGRRIGIKSRLFFLGGFGLDGVSGAVRLLTILAKYTFVVESFGALLLYWGFIRHGIPVEKSIYYAVFHSVSAFCNAGFSPLPNGLNGFPLYNSPCCCDDVNNTGGYRVPGFCELLGSFMEEKQVVALF